MVESGSGLNESPSKKTQGGGQGKGVRAGYVLPHIALLIGIPIMDKPDTEPSKVEYLQDTKWFKELDRKAVEAFNKAWAEKADKIIIEAMRRFMIKDTGQ